MKILKLVYFKIFQFDFLTINLIIKLDGFFPTFAAESWSFFNISSPPSLVGAEVAEESDILPVSAPFIKCSFTINRDFQINIFKNRVQISHKYFAFLEPGGRCRRYSILNRLAIELLNFELENDVNFKEQISIISQDLDKFIENENFDENKLKKIKFLKEQLQLVCCNSPRYSLDSLIFSMLFFSSYPAGYRFLRDYSNLTLPSPNYLSSFNKGNIQTGAASQYLSKQFSFLEPHEKYVNLLMDEIYVKPFISFKGDNILGVAENIQASNSTEAATTVQVIMISSLLSNYTDVVGIYPIKRLDGEYSVGILDDVMILLHNIGFEVVDVISDNNAVNSRAFKLLANSETIPACIPNKYVASENKKIFFTFDPPHILKCFRNIFQKVKNFHFKSLENPDTFCLASISDLEKIYDIERFNTVKLAPQLSHKVLHTSPLDKQNVYLALCLFNKKNIEALKFYREKLSPNVDGTIEFLNIVVNVWDILNVKTPEKGLHLRNEFMKPINSLSNPSIIFLKKASSWFKSWYAFHKSDFINSPFYNEIVRVGKLSRETHTAITHTIDTLITLSEYLLTDESFNGLFKYVLMGNFSTDKLEFHFSLYRKMSGHNYHVSVRQIVESQKKLNCIKALKLKQNLNCSVPVKVFLKEFSCEENISLCPVDEIDEILNLASKMEMSPGDINVVIYIAGYVAKKTSERLKCLSCQNFLFFENHIMTVEFSDETEYLRGLDCGGLKYPSDFSTEVGIRALKVFRSVTSEHFESSFIKCNNHKSFLFSTIIEYVESLTSDNSDLPCSHFESQIMEISVGIWTKILLNNYTKELNDTTHQSSTGASTHFTTDLTKRRKLNTFTRPTSNLNNNLI